MTRTSISILAALALARAASAQPTDNKALAEQLFNQGRDLAKADKWADACPKFEASLRYDPTLGTRLNLATCYEKIGKLASAWALYRESAEVAGKAGDTKRKDYAVAQSSALEPRIPKLTIAAPSTTPAGLVVTRDGTALDPAALGTPLYVDPGPHTLGATAPGFQAFTKSIQIGEGEEQTLTIPPLTPVPVEPVKPVETKPPPPPPPPPPPSQTRKFVGIGAAATGAIVLGVGIGFGIKARSTYGDAKDVCGPSLACGDADFDRAQQLVDDARSQAMVSTIGFIAGGALVATGVILWLTAPSATPTETARLVPVADDTSVGLVLTGGF